MEIILGRLGVRPPVPSTISPGYPLQCTHFRCYPAQAEGFMILNNYWRPCSSQQATGANTKKNYLLKYLRQT
jgi:hypothetical protein